VRKFRLKKKFTTQYQLQPTDFNSEMHEHITHVPAICHNLPISKFTADRKKHDQSSTDEHLSMMFLQKYVDEQFLLWTQHFDRRCVHNPTI
jgi:hypothetical protein